MKNKLKNIPIQLAITIAILVFLIVFINIATATMGRYTTSFGGEFNFVANSKRTINVSCGEWEEKAGFNLLPIEMTCTNGATDTAQSMSARIRLYIPETTSLPTEILISDGKGQYAATLSAIPIGTAAYRSYGSGMIGCFYDTNGNELVMEISQSTEWIARATLIFYGALIDTSGVRVIVEPVNEQDIMGGSI